MTQSPAASGLKFRTAHYTLVLGAMLLGYGCKPVISEPASVSIQPTRLMVINNQRQIQNRVFGATAYEGAPLPATLQGREQLQNLRLSVLGLAGNIHWCAPDKLPPNGAAGIEAWYASPAARQKIEGGLLYGDKYLLGRILPGVRKADIEPMVYLRGGPSWAVDSNGVPLNDEIYAALVTSYVGLLRKVDPKLRLFHLLNEPNTFYYKSRKSGADYARTFVTVSRALKKRYPDVLLGGPVSCWPPSYPLEKTSKPEWYLWDEWTVPFLEIAGKDLDFFDFHHYDKVSREDRSQFIESALEQVQLISTVMERKLGRRVPVYITEWGLPLSQAEWKDPVAHWRRRTLPSARFLLDVLDKPDKVVSMQVFDIGAQLNPEANHAVFNLTDSATQTPTYWLYWLMRQNRGMRLVTNVSAPTPGLRVLATRSLPDASKSEPEVALFALNDSDISREISLTFDSVPRWINTPRWERLYLDGATGQVKRDSGTGKVVSMPPRSMLAAVVNLPRETPYAPALEERDFYSTNFLQEFSAGTNAVTLPVNIPAGVLVPQQSAELRIGIQGTLETDRFQVSLGGQQYTFKGGSEWVLIPLNVSPVTGVNSVSVTRLSAPAGQRVRVSSVSIALKRQLF